MSVHGTKMNRISRQHQRLLEDWLKTVWEEHVLGKKQSQNGIAKLAAASCIKGLEGITITGGNVRGACEALGWEWPNRIHVDRLGRIEGFDQRLTRTEERLAWLFHKLGEIFPDEQMEEPR